MTDEIFFDGVRYLSATEAASSLGLARDYIARLCKEGKLLGRRIGRHWYVNDASLQAFAIKQEYEYAKRSEELRHARRLEYGTGSMQKETVHPPGESSPDHASIRGMYMHGALESAMRDEKLFEDAKPITAPNPITISSSSGRIPASLHALTPGMEFLHKLAAVVVVLVLTAGTYMFVNAEYARVAMRSPDAQKQLAAAAENQSAIGNIFTSLARAINAGVDSLVYGTMFKGSFASLDPATSVADSAQVSVQVVPGDTSNVNGPFAPASTSPVTATTTTPEYGGQPVPQTVINQPVIERVVETQRVVTVGGISEDIFNEKLQQLDNRLTSQISSLSAQGSQNSAAISQSYQVIAQTNKIDKLDSIDITNSTISGGSISGVSISGSSISGTSVSGTNGSFGSATTTSLVVTGSATSTFGGGISAAVLDITSTLASSTFANGLVINGGCVLVNDTCLGSATVAGADTQVQFNNGGTLGASSNFLFSTSTNLLEVTSASTTLFSSFGPAYFGATATTTIDAAGNVAVAGTLNVTGNTTLSNASSTSFSVSGTGYFGTASTTNLTISGVPSVLLSTNASGVAQSATIGASLSFSSNTLSLNTANANTWTALQVFNAAASTTLFSTYGPAYFGATATSSFAADGALTLATPLATSSGGTGISSYAVGDLLYVNNSGVLARLPVGSAGQVLKVSGGVPAYGSDLLGSGGAGAFATTSDDLALYPATVSNVLVLGASATSTTGNILEVLGNSLFRGNLTSYNTITGATFTATSTLAASTFPFASSTALTASGTIYSDTASTSNLTVSNIQNSLLYTGTTGVVTGASVTYPLQFSSGTLSLAFGTTTANTWSNLQTFTSGFVSTASSTVGDGTQTGGLTISGGATTTGATTLSGALTYGGVTLANAVTGTGNMVLSASPTLTGTIAGAAQTLSGTLGVTGQTTLVNASSTALTSATLYSDTASTSNLTISGIQSALLLNSAGGVAGAYSGSTCTNQFVRSLNGAGAATCAAVSLTLDVTGILPIANGGTATSTGGVTNGVEFYDGSKLTNSSALTFNGTNLGIGTTTPETTLDVYNTSSGATADQLYLTNAASATSTASRLSFRALDVLGNGTTTSAITSVLTQNYVAGNGDLMFSVLNAGALVEAARISSAGYLGVGTSTPYRRLSITDAGGTANPQVALAYDAGNDAQIRVDNLGGLSIDASGNQVYLNNDNLWVCTGGSISTNGCPSAAPSGQGNLFVENRFGIGTSTLGVSNANNLFTIDAQDSTSNLLSIGTSTDATGGTRTSIFTIPASGNVGIATSSPFARLAVGAGGAIMTTENVLTDAATVTVSWQDGNQQKVTLGGNRTINFSNYIAGAILRLVVCQDGTGSRTVTWDSSVLWQGGTAPTLTTTANQCDLATFVATNATSTLKIFGAAATAF